MAVRVRSRRIAWFGLAVATIAIVLAVGVVGWRLNPASLKPRLIEAVRRATGRELTISGDVGIKLSLVPTVSMENVSLANPPGFSRPDIITVNRVELGLSLWPLLRHRLVVDHVTLVRPDVVFETDAGGHPNWVFARPVVVAPAVPPSAEPPPPPAPQQDARSSQPPVTLVPTRDGEKRRLAVTFKGASVVDGRFGFIDGKAHHQYFADTPRVSLDASRDGPVDLNGTIVFDGQTINVTGHAEPDAMQNTGALPVALKLETGGATLTAEGRIADPTRGRGYTLALDASVPDPSMLAPFFARLPLTAFHDVTARVDIGDSGGPLPTIAALQVKAGAVDLDTPGFVRFGHGVRLNDVAVTARGEGPIQVAANLSLAGAGSAFSGTIGDLPWLARGASGPVAVDLRWSGASARGAVRGTIQHPASLTGLALDVGVNVPDPSVVMHDAPAALKDVMFRARLSDGSGPTPFQVTSNAGDLTGQVTVSRTPRLTINGQIWSQHLDVDLLRGRPGAVAGAGPASRDPGQVAPGVSSIGPLSVGSSPPGLASNSNGLSGAAPAPPSTPSRPAAGSAVPVNTPLIPDTKLPFEMVRAVDGSVHFSFGDVHVDGTDIRKIDGVATAKDGLLRVDPFTISAIAQRTDGILEVDASKSPPSVHVVVTAPGLALWPTLAALGLPQMATGSVAVRADLTGTGDTPRAIAGSLNGWAGVAVEGGQLDAESVNAWLGKLQPLHIGGPKVADLKCFAMRADAKDGVLAVQSMALDTAALIIEGSGDVDLRHETLALRLRPRARIGGTGIALPVRLTGPMRDPTAKIDISPKGFGGGALAGLILGGGKDVMGAAGGGDPCPDSLARARAPVGTASDPGQGAPK